MQEITKTQYLKKLATLRPSLAEAVTILSFEPEGSVEASRLTFAEKYLANIDLPWHSYLCLKLGKNLTVFYQTGFPSDLEKQQQVGWVTRLGFY